MIDRLRKLGEDEQYSMGISQRLIMLRLWPHLIAVVEASGKNHWQLHRGCQCELCKNLTALRAAVEKELPATAAKETRP